MVTLEKNALRTSEAAWVPSPEAGSARVTHSPRADVLAAWRQAQVDAFFDGVAPVLSLPGRASC